VFDMRFVLAALLAAAAADEERWTFCVAESGREIWITDVFAAARGRERLEADFEALLRARGVARPVAQCPEPQRDKIEAVNSQFTAAEFHRRLGDTLHSAAAPDIGR
jgi:hypothetical protein